MCSLWESHFCCVRCKKNLKIYCVLYEKSLCSLWWVRYEKFAVFVVHGTHNSRLLPLLLMFCGVWNVEKCWLVQLLPRLLHSLAATFSLAHRLKQRSLLLFHFLFHSCQWIIWSIAPFHGNWKNFFNDSTKKRWDEDMLWNMGGGTRT